ncbi:hypothetical protein [Planomonospora venezuelensis]|uniref:Uncharacterized protein n=1 Tax=Planomonospora venezuelensis TaxID=1999 RepID=A0A841DDD0_PLAVE|nr:hypothetical protein [Planomonospora venezuelensis]MBB5966105.1 hypothetical protein [Planomonospora venezuelensis]GIN04647.1 hypothetical protein Pve01_63050 [Planomonospora venezuelensis]
MTAGRGVTAGEGVTAGRESTGRESAGEADATGVVRTEAGAGAVDAVAVVVPRTGGVEALPPTRSVEAPLKTSNHIKGLRR